MKICDNTSVGIFVWKEEKLLLIERARFPAGFELPAGHVDGDDTFEIAAIRELKEEVGLDATNINLILEERKENECRREGGSWHYWKLYKADAMGDIHPSVEETKKVDWYSIDDIKQLSLKTEDYLNKKITEEDWTKSPGLEPVMYEFFKKLNII